MSTSRSLLVGGAPFIHERSSTAGNSWWTLATLLPSLMWGSLILGWRAFLVVGAAVAAAALADILQSAARKRFEIIDGTALLTGIMIGFSMPVTIPLVVPIAAAAFAILIVKGAFGGLGNNWMNPGLAGVAFAWLNWPKAMSNLAEPAAFGSSGIAGTAMRDNSALVSAFVTNSSSIDAKATSFLNEYVFAPAGANLPEGYFGLALGFRGGSIGELSGFILLLSSIILISRRIVRWQVPASIFASFAALQWIFGGILTGNGYFSGDVLVSVFSGSFLLVSFFMATDPVTSPSRKLSMVLYGAGIGGLIFILRLFGSRTEAVAFAVIIMNCTVPLMETIRTRRSGKGVR